ncbi:hypothetical protein ACLOJK_003132 [Asimina triloba]
MVGALEEKQLQRLESQVENGGGGAWEYLCLVRKTKARRPDKVLKFGFPILQDPTARSKLGSEGWTLYEQVAVAAMDCHQFDVARVLIFHTNITAAYGSDDLKIWEHMDCINTLQKKFPDSMRVGRLEAMLLEAKGLWADAEAAYIRLLEDNPLDQVLYTLGGLENLQTAKKYYASTIDLSGGKNTRALFGVCLSTDTSESLQCSNAISQLTRGRNKEEESSELQSLAATLLEKGYKQRAPSKLPLITATLNNMKLS